MGHQSALVIQAEWDDEAKVWVATSDDVPGLIAEADTVEALDTKIRALIPELIELNGLPDRFGTEIRRTIPLSLIAKRREDIVLLN